MKRVRKFLCAAMAAVMMVSCAERVEVEVGVGAPKVVTDVESGDTRGNVKSVLYGKNEFKVVYNEQGWISELYTSRIATQRVLRLAAKYHYAEDNKTLLSIESIDYKWDGTVSSRIEEQNTTAEQRARVNEEEDVVYQYDEDGNLSRTIEFRVFTALKQRKFIDTYTYNEAGQLVEYATDISERPESDFKSPEREAKIDFRTRKFEPVLSRVVKCEYNEQGDVITETTYNSEGEVTKEFKFEYTYDDHGNWLTKKGGISPNSVISRVIEYFPN